MKKHKDHNIVSVPMSYGPTVYYLYIRRAIHYRVTKMIELNTFMFIPFI